MKRISRISISIVLVLVMVLSMFTTAFAANGTQEAAVQSDEIFTYLSIGDSTTNGYCLEGYSDESYGFNCIVPNSYPYQIKTKLEAEGKKVAYYPYGVNAMRPDELDAILDPNHWMDDFTHRAFYDEGREERFKDMANALPGVSVSSSEDALKVLRENYFSVIDKADLITYYLGNNNFGTFIQAAITNQRYGDDDTLEDLLTNATFETPFTMEQIKEIQAQVRGLLADELGEDTLSTLNYTTRSGEVRSLADLCVHAFVSFVLYFEKNIQTMRAINPDCDIVVLSMHNYIDFIKAEFNGTVVDLGEVYGYLEKLADVYMAQLSASANDFYYADTMDAEIEVFFDELLSGTPTYEMQSELDYYIGGMTKDILANMAGNALPPLEAIAANCGVSIPEEYNGLDDEEIYGRILRHWKNDGFTTDLDFALLALFAPSMIGEEAIPELPEGLTLADAIRLSWLYHNKDDAFVEAIYPFVADTDLGDQLKSNRGKFITFSSFKSTLSRLKMLSGLAWLFGYDYTEELEELDSILETLDEVGTELEEVRKYGRIQDVMLSCINTDPLSASMLANLDDLLNNTDAVAQNIMNAALYDEKITDDTRLAVNLNFLFMFNDGMCIHPNRNGYQKIADVVWNAYKGKNTAKPYMSKKIMNTLADLVDELTANMVIPESHSNSLCTSDSIDSYTSLGDSTVFGYGFEDFAESDENVGEYAGYERCADNSYPALLCKELGIESGKFHQLAMSSMRVEDVHYLLDDTYTGDWYSKCLKESIYDGAKVVEKGSDKDSVDLLREDYKKAILESDLVTLGVGGNNTTGYMLSYLEAMAEGSPHEIEWTLYSENALVQYKDMLGKISSSLTVLNPELDPEMLNIMAQCLLYEYIAFTENYDDVVEHIHEINPNAEILLIGLYNPTNNLYFKLDETDPEYKPINVDSILNYLVANFNSTILKEAESRDYCSYVDITKTERFLDSDSNEAQANHNVGCISEEIGLPEYCGYLMTNPKSTHPSLKGHEYIKNQIMGVLGHNYGEWIDEIPATCTEDGTIAHYHCDACGTNFDADYNALESIRIPSGHLISENWSLNKYYHWRTCDKCSEIIDKDEHEYGDDDICDTCGYIKSQVACTTTKTVSSLVNGNTYAFFDSSDNELHRFTVESSGNKWLLYNDELGYLTFANGELGYSANKSNAYAWTFSNKRFTASVTTQRSGSLRSSRTTTTTYYLKDGYALTVTTSTSGLPTLYQLVENADHTYGTWIAEVPATCTESGTVGHYHCTVCGKDFDATHKELSSRSLVIPATGHKFSEEWNHDGTYHWHECINEGCTTTDTKIKHTYGDDGKCTDCGCEKPAISCHAKKTVSSLTDGESYTFFNSSGDELHTFAVVESGSKWLINTDEGYLTFASGKLGYSANKSDAYAWTFSNKRFTASITTQRSGSFRSSRTTTTTYYLKDGDTMTVTTSTSGLPTLYQLIENADHAFGVWTSNGNGTHTRVCTNCGTETQTENCMYDSSTHKCYSCGAYDPKYINVGITVTETVKKSGSRNSRQQYIYTINTTATGTTVKQTRYSTNGSSWKTGTSYTSRSRLSVFYVKVTDASGNVYDYTWKAQ